MLLATVLALTAAVMHAGWNLAVKQSGDRFIALWGQFAMAGVIGAVIVVVVEVVTEVLGIGAGGAGPRPGFGGVGAAGWAWAGVSALAHIPYGLGLVGAYRRGDFSLTYPIARGAGAVLASVGGVVMLGDRYRAWAVLGLVICALGVLSLGSGRAPGIGHALVVSAAIGVYSVVDAHAIRSTHSPWYAAASHVAVAVSLTTAGIALGRGRDMVGALRANWVRFTAFGCVVGGTYALVQVAFRLAPVGYVTSLRESSVVIAAVVGVTVMHETSTRRGRARILSAVVMVAGLVILVAGM